MSQAEPYRETAPVGFDAEGWPLPEVRSAMMENFARSWTRHWLAVLIIFAVSLFLILGPIMLITPRWEGHANAIINDQALPNLNVTGAATAAPPDVEMMVANLIEVVKSRPFLERVAQDPQVQLPQYFQNNAENPTWRDRIKQSIRSVVTLRFLRSSGGEPDWTKRAVDELESDWITIAPLEKTSIIPIIVFGDHPDKTVEVGNAVLQHLRDFMDEQYREAVSAQLPTLQAQVDRLEQEVDAKEQEITDFLVQTGYADPAARADKALDGLTALEQQQATIELELEGAQRQQETLENELAQHPVTLDLVRKSDTERPAASTEQSLRTRLATLKAEREGLLASLSPNSREVRSLEAEVNSLENQIEELREDERETFAGEQVSPILNPKQQQTFSSWQSARSRVIELQARQAGLTAAIDTLRDAQREAVRTVQSLDAMKREKAKRQQELDALYSRLVDYETMLHQPRVFNSMQIYSGAWIEDPTEPDYPNMLLAGVIALVVAAFTALVLPVGYDYVNQTLLSSRQAASLPGVRVIATAPKMRSGRMFKPAG